MTERELQNGIYEYLVKSGIEVVQRDRQYLKHLRIGVKPEQRGVSDIWGCLKPHGRMFAIEVKLPKGKLTQDQIDFLARVRRSGGIAFVARRLDDVIEGLRCPS